MTALSARRARLVEVRRLQHLQSALAAAGAEQRALALETSAERLGQLRASLVTEVGTTSGAYLSSLGELATRLERARDGLTDAIISARATAADAVALRLEARIRQEGAERLHSRAAAAEEAEREGHLASLPCWRAVRGADH